MRLSLGVKLLLLCGGLDLALGALAHLLTQRRLPLEAGWEEWAEAQRTVWTVVGLGGTSALAWAYLLWRLSWARLRLANARAATWWLPSFRRLGSCEVACCSVGAWQSVLRARQLLWLLDALMASACPRGGTMRARLRYVSDGAALICPPLFSPQVWHTRCVTVQPFILLAAQIAANTSNTTPDVSNGTENGSMAGWAAPHVNTSGAGETNCSWQLVCDMNNTNATVEPPAFHLSCAWLG